MFSSIVSYDYSSAIRNEIINQTGGNGALLYSDDEISKLANKANTNIAVYFDVISNHSIEINDNIADNWLENTTVVNDCIAHAPIAVTLSGISGELVYKPSMNRENGFLRNAYKNINDKLAGKYSSEYVVTDKLTVLPQLLPPVDNITQTAKNLITTIEDNIMRYKKIAENFLAPKERQTRLEEIYNKLLSLRESRTPIIVETPYTTLENMYMQSISLTQDNQAHITDISITLKQVKTSEVLTTKANPNVLAEINAQMRAKEENLGKVQGKAVNSSIIYEWLGQGLDAKKS